MSEKQIENIDNLAMEANEIMAENKYYHKKLSLYDKYITMTKNIITNLLSNNNTELAIECFNKYIEEIQKDYDNMNKAYEKNELLEYNELINNCFSEITMGKPILKQKQNQKFYLEYKKREKDDIIKDLKRSIKKSKEFQLFREPSRYTFIEEKEGAKEIEKNTNELQQNMLYELKKCNKFKERILKYNEQIKDIENNIDIIKNSMKQNENISNISIDNNINNIQIFEEPEIDIGKLDIKKSYNVVMPKRLGLKMSKKKFEEDNKSEGGSEDRKKNKNEKEKRKKQLIPGFENVEQLFEMSDVDPEKEKMIYDDLNSDDEFAFENKIKQPIKLTEFHFDEIKKEIPVINLAQIEYNKMQLVKEDDLYSIQRRKYKSQNMDNNIKELKKNIEKKELQLEQIKQKEKIMKDYIEKYEKIYKDLRKFRRKNTSVQKKGIPFIKKSLLYSGEENIEEELSDEGEGVISSDYDNEENEKDDFGKGKKSVAVLDGNDNKKWEQNKGIWKNGLGKSVRDDMFKNNLRKKIKKIRAKSK